MPPMNKYSSSIIIAIIALSTLTACTPEDKNLNRPNFNTQGGPSGKGLRVGAYGQTIWAAQNVEQIGALMQFCLASDKTTVQKLNGIISKNCRLKPVGNFVEIWMINLNLKETSSGFSIISAVGEMLRGRAVATFNGTNITLRYDKKTFAFEENGNNQFALELFSAGELKSEKETIKFEHEITGEGVLSTQTWFFRDLEHSLILFDRNQVFRVSSNDLKLDWINPLCAEFSGMTLAVENNRAPTAIALSSKVATQKLPNGKDGSWNQKFNPSGCGRSSTVLNFEFLFY